MQAWNRGNRWALNLKSYLKELYIKEDSSTEIEYIKKELADTGNYLIVDYGCGNGRILKGLKNTFPSNRIIAIDKNSNSVAKVRNQGFEAYLAESAGADKALNECHVLLLIHVVEHMETNQIIELINKCRNLKQVIIITPVFNKEFYNDPDHKRPYPPRSLKILFSDGAQIAMNTNRQLLLGCYQYKKSPLRVFTKQPIGENFSYSINLILWLLHIIFPCVFSRTTAYMLNFKACR
jgi:hypothetical protein